MTVRRLVLIAVAVVFSTTFVAAQKGGAKWVNLGQRIVTDRADHDTIVVTAAKGTFRAVKFEVVGHAVQFHRVVIHFGSGADQTVQMKDVIRAGGSTRDIDLEGGARVIRSIDFWYDAQTIGRGGKATVRALARE